MSKNPNDFIQAHRALIAVVCAALVIGVGAGYWLSRGPGAPPGKPDQPIEWNRVQAVPTRAPDAEDVEWQDRANALDAAKAPPVNDEKSGGNDTARLENASQ